MFRSYTWIACVAIAAVAAAADDFNREPINYKDAKADNAVADLQTRIAAGKSPLVYADGQGYLPTLLTALNVPRSSQVLVYSKTSLQRQRIAPETPRAIYFNDDVYVGYCQHGDLIEVSAADTALGTAFYTLDQRPEAKPQFTRQTDTCLICHATSATGGVPGHLVRSVVTDRHGQPILSAGSHHTNHTSPFAERWGGWYVTGTHGKQVHMGNAMPATAKGPRAEGSEDGQNVTDLSSRFAVAKYLTPHSDLVALLVLEHQTECHTLLARAMIEARQARYYQDGINKSLGEPAGTTWDSVTRRIETAGNRLAKYLLFSREAKLDGPVAGTSDFAREFAARGPFDRSGRSLRQFDLKTRLFKYPCSYLVYSKAFAALPTDVKGATLKRLHEVLTGKDTSADFAHLSADDRKAVLEILRATLPDLPAYWQG